MQDERFSLTNKVYGQYFQLYFQRLTLVAGPLLAQAQKQWPGVPGAFLSLAPRPRSCHFGSPRRQQQRAASRAAHRARAGLRACATVFPPRKP